MGGGEHRRRDHGAAGEGLGIVKPIDRGGHRQVRKAITQKEQLEYGDCLEGVGGDGWEGGGRIASMQCNI